MVKRGIVSRVVADLSREEAHRVSMYVESLGGRHSEIFRLALKGQTQTEIAQALGVNQSNISRMLKRIVTAIGQMEIEYNARKKLERANGLKTAIRNNRQDRD